MFEQFSGERRGRERRRLLASLGAATAVYAVLGVSLAFVLARAVTDDPPAEDPVDVKFYKAPPAPPPPPQAPAAAPPPPPPPPKAAPRPPAPRVAPPRPFEAPASVPEQAPAEADPSEETGNTTPPGEGSPEGRPGGKEGGDAVGADPDGTGSAPAPGPVVLPPGATPPVRTDQLAPEYPEGARSARVEGEVIAKVVVHIDGTVTLVQIVKSSPEFDAAVKAFLPKMRFRPAMYSGRPIAVYKNIRFPFTLR